MDSENTDIDETKASHRTQRINKADATGVEKKRSWPFPWPVGYAALWLVVITSLALNVIILRQLVTAREVTRQAVNDAIAVVENLKGQGFSHTIVVDETLVIEADMPVQETIPIPINETFQVNAAATIPINLGPLGTETITIPVGGEVPVNTTIEIELDRVFHVSTAVPVYFEVPVEIKLASTPLYVTLEDVQIRLEALSKELGKPLLPFLQPAPPTVEAND